MSFIRGLPVTAGGGGGSSFAGTPGSIVFLGAGGTFAQDNANLFYDDANNRQGIGINSGLSARLHIVGDNTPAAQPLGLRVDSSAANLGNVFFGDIALTAYATDPIAFELTPPAIAGARQRTMRIVGGALTNVAGGELIDVTIGGRNVQFNTGTTQALQRAIFFNAPTYSATTTKQLTQAATLHIGSAPIAGTNVTIGNGAGVVQTGAQFGFALISDGGLYTTNSAAGLSRPPPLLTTCRVAYTTMLAGFQYSEIYCDTASGLTWNGAAPSNYFGVVLNNGGTGLSAGSVSTVSIAASVYIAAVPTAGGNVTISNAYALYAPIGASLFNSVISSNDISLSGTLRFSSNLVTMSGGATPANITLSTAMTSGFTIQNNDGTPVVLMFIDPRNPTGTSSIRRKVAFGTSNPTNLAFVEVNDPAYTVTDANDERRLIYVTGGTATLNASVDGSEFNQGQFIGRTLAWTTNGTVSIHRSWVFQGAVLTASVAKVITEARALNANRCTTGGAGPASITNNYAIVSGGALSIRGAVDTSITPTTLLTVFNAAYATIPNVEFSHVKWDFAHDSAGNANVVQFGQNTLLATQRAAQIIAPTYSSSVATKTITDAVTLDIDAAPTAGTNAAITNAYALRAQAGAVKFAGTLLVGAINITAGILVDTAQPVATSGTPIGIRFVGGAHTGLTAGADINDVLYNLARTVQRATGAVAAARAVFLQAPTYSFVGASTITAAATLAIDAAPVAGTNATITNSYAAWFGAKIRIDSAAALGGGAAPTFGTIGGTGPTAAAQNEWIAIDTQNGKRWVPAWA